MGSRDSLGSPGLRLAPGAARASREGGALGHQLLQLAPWPQGKALQADSTLLSHPSNPGALAVLPALSHGPRLGCRPFFSLGPGAPSSLVGSLPLWPGTRPSSAHRDPIVHTPQIHLADERKRPPQRPHLWAALLGAGGRRGPRVGTARPGAAVERHGSAPPGVARLALPAERSRFLSSEVSGCRPPEPCRPGV